MRIPETASASEIEPGHNALKTRALFGNHFEDTEARKQGSLATRKCPEALSLVNARNESVRVPQLNRKRRTG